MATHFFGSDFFGGEFFFAGAEVFVDTHDGADRRRDERIRRYREDRESLRRIVREAVEGPPEVRAVVAPFVAADEPVSPDAHFDYAALEQAADALRALAEWALRVELARAAEDDDEDVLLLI